MGRIRETLGAKRFEEAFAAGSRLTQQDAIAAAREMQSAAIDAT